MQVEPNIVVSVVVATASLAGTAIAFRILLETQRLKTEMVERLSEIKVNIAKSDAGQASITARIDSLTDRFGLLAADLAGTKKRTEAIRDYLVWLQAVQPAARGEQPAAVMFQPPANMPPMPTLEDS